MKVIRKLIGSLEKITEFLYRNTYFVWFEVLTAVVMKSSITTCSPLRVNRPFGGKYCFHLHGSRISQTRNQGESRQQVTTTVS
jgi:hypothetical protein